MYSSTIQWFLCFFFFFFSVKPELSVHYWNVIKLRQRSEGHKISWEWERMLTYFETFFCTSLLIHLQLHKTTELKHKISPLYFFEPSIHLVVISFSSCHSFTLTTVLECLFFLVPLSPGWKDPKIQRHILWQHGSQERPGDQGWRSRAGPLLPWDVSITCPLYDRYIFFKWLSICGFVLLLFSNVHISVPETHYENVNMRNEQRVRAELVIPRYHQLLTQLEHKKVSASLMTITWYDLLSKGIPRVIHALYTQWIGFGLNGLSKRLPLPIKMVWPTSTSCLHQEVVFSLATRNIVASWGHV